MGDNEWNPQAPDMGQSFTNAAVAPAQYNIYFRSIDFDLHLSRDAVSPEFDKEIVEKQWGMESGIGGFANHEYVEIMKQDPATGGEILDTRFQAVGVINDPAHPTGFRMTPDDRLVTIVSNTEQTPIEKDVIFHDDAHFDQARFKGQLQGVDDPGENSLVVTVNEEQMLQIKLAMLNASIEINQDNPGFGLTGIWDPNSNSYRNTMGEIIRETADQLGIKVNAAFDPEGLSPGAGQRIPTEPVKLFEGSVDELREAVKNAEITHARQLDALRQDINADLKPQEPAEPQAGLSGAAIKPLAPSGG